MNTEQNIEMLKSNQYPGRGIIIGMTPSGAEMVQIYWIMGRSANSRNRIFEKDGDFVRTRAFDESKVVDPTLIIYYPLKTIFNNHIITNGDQTETILTYIKEGKTFENALDTRCFEPDPPNYTPRISGIVKGQAYKLSILKAIDGEADISQRNLFSYEKGMPGIGHCIHTYQMDGNPLPSFNGEPYEVKIFGEIERNLEFYWSLLNEENRISILVKHIKIADNSIKIEVKNKL